MLSRAEAREAIADLLREEPGASAREIVGLLAGRGVRIPKSTVNSILYSNARLFERDESGGAPTWFLADSTIDAGPTPAPPRTTRDEWAPELSLYPWQQEALDAWSRNQSLGVIEAVTGTGKTRVAIAAAQQHLRVGGKVLVLIHTNELLRQWERELRQQLIGTCGMSDLRIGLAGASFTSSLRSSDVLVSTVQTAINQPELLPQGSYGLLIADEVHHYGAPKWSKALSPAFERRLGLTATYERQDSGCQEFLTPYFERVVFSVGYGRALREDVIAPFKIAFIGVPFLPQEREIYDEYAERASRHRWRLIAEFGVPEEPFGDFMRETARLAKEGSYEAADVAKKYLFAFSGRRKVLASARAKYWRLQQLAPAISAADRSILFTQTIETAKTAVSVLAEEGIRGAVMTSDMDMDSRRDVFAAFEEGEHELVGAPKLLDEGIDVPAADLGVVLAASRSRRQMIQRMGRVIRKKEDRRLARLAVLYIDGTSEDPKMSQEDFLYLVTDDASDIRYFDGQSDYQEICGYLNAWRAN